MRSLSLGACVALSVLMLTTIGCGERPSEASASDLRGRGSDVAADASSAPAGRGEETSARPVGGDSDVPAGALVIALSADMSGESSRSGESIRRGIELAIDDVNGRGGVLGRPLHLIVRDHRGNPVRGRDNVEALADVDGLVAVFAGLHTPVALAELEPIHTHGIPYLVPWAAGTPVIDNGRSPNYAFRVSVRDEYAGGFLVGRIRAMGMSRPALLLEKTGWGRSNARAMSEALAAHGLEPANVSWFAWGVEDLSPTIAEIHQSGADCILLVGNAPEGRAVLAAMDRVPAEQRLPIISHWGVTGGNFFRDAKSHLKGVNFSFLQTFSFIDPPYPDRAQPVIDAYCARYADADGPLDIFAPAGTAHAWDLVHLLARAIEQAGSADHAAVRDALEQLGPYEGLVKTYARPFTAERHDALDVRDLNLSRYDSTGVIRRVEPMDQP